MRVRRVHEPPTPSWWLKKATPDSFCSDTCDGSECGAECRWDGGVLERRFKGGKLRLLYIISKDFKTHIK